MFNNVSLLTESNFSNSWWLHLIHILLVFLKEYTSTHTLYPPLKKPIIIAYLLYFPTWKKSCFYNLYINLLYGDKSIKNISEKVILLS